MFQVATICWVKIKLDIALNRVQCGKNSRQHKDNRLTFGNAKATVISYDVKTWFTTKRQLGLYCSQSGQSSECGRVYEQKGENRTVNRNSKEGWDIRLGHRMFSIWDKLLRQAQ